MSSAYDSLLIEAAISNHLADSVVEHLQQTASRFGSVEIISDESYYKAPDQRKVATLVSTDPVSSFQALLAAFAPIDRWLFSASGPDQDATLYEHVEETTAIPGLQWINVSPWVSRPGV